MSDPNDVACCLPIPSPERSSSAPQKDKSAISRTKRPIQQSIAFLDLPAELRIAIYNTIVDTNTSELAKAHDDLVDGDLYELSQATTDTPLFRIPTSHELSEYSGFILSCKQIEAEFNSEWSARFNSHVQCLMTDPPLFYVPCVTKLCDSVCLELCLPSNLFVSVDAGSWWEDTKVIHSLVRLLQYFPLIICVHTDMMVLRNLYDHMQWIWSAPQTVMAGTNQDRIVVGYAWKAVVEKGMTSGGMWKGLRW